MVKKPEYNNKKTEDDSRTRMIFNNIPNPVICTNPDFSIRWVNRAFENLTGFTSEDVAGARAPYPWWPPENHQEYLAELNVAREGKKHKSDWLFRTRDGRDFWIKANVSPVKENDRVIYLLANWVDITDNKIAEEKLKRDIDRLNTVRRQHLEETIQRLRNSLTGLRGYIDSLLTSDLEWDSRQRTGFLKEAIAEADHLEGIIEDMAILEKVESGNMVLDQRVYAVTELLSDAGPRLQALAKNHKLSMKVIPNLPGIYIDETRLIQVLADLLENAVQTAPSGSQIEITAGNSPEGVEISIISSSQGGSPQSPEEIGLEWELAMKVITAHGGKIRLESDPGKSRRFSFTLPVVREA